MVELNLDEVKKECKSFKEYNTYVFVQTTTHFYNGYICSVHDDAFMFMDDNIPNPFPIRFDSLRFPVVPSKKKGGDFNFGRKDG